MALVIADRVKETSLTTGTSTIVLAGAAGGFQAFSVIGDGNSTYYCIAGQGSSQWEVGIGTYTASGTTLSRDTVLSSSAGGTTKVTFSSGTKDVFITYPSERSVNLDISGNVTNLGDITSGVWKGTTIATTYGGTGLSGATPFTAANNAVYSTSATALTAGTLPVPAGGTGLASYTAGDLSYYTSGTALTKLPIGASTTILTSSSTAPQWSATSGISVGNATTANTLTTARNIAGVPFNGSANIVIPLANLSDVDLDVPLVNQLLGYNGSQWTNTNAPSAGAGPGVVFYNATPVISAVGANNATPIATLATTPVVTAEQTVTGTASNNTVLFSAFISAALNRTIIDAGVWNFTNWIGVNAATGTNLLTRQIYTSTPFVVANTVTITGTGTSRTATASGGTPFATAAIDASATNTVASYLQTPAGLYQITARTSDTVVTILTPSGYTNESGVVGVVLKKLFGITTSEITSVTPNYGLYEVTTTATSYPITALAGIGILGFFTSTTGTITVTYNGTTHNTHVSTPLANVHNDLAGLQGGSASSYYHSTLTEYTGTGTGVFVRAINPTLASLTDSGNLTFTGTGNRITGDMSNGTVASRVMFQTSTAGSNSVISAIPNGAGTQSSFVAAGNSDPTNASIIQMLANGTTDTRLVSTFFGTGTFLPMTFHTGGSARVTIDTSGNVGIGADAVASLQVSKLTTVLSGTGNAFGVYVYPTSSGACYIDALTNLTGLTDLSLRTYNNGTYNAFIGTASGGTATTFKTGGTEKMRIDSSGNVGIGLTPTASVGDLQVSGVAFATSKLYVGAAGSTAFSGGIQNLSNVSCSVSLEADPTNVGANSIILFKIDATERMRIDSSGNVAIGTATTPVAKLDVANSNGRVARVGGIQISGATATADAGNNFISSGAYWNGTNYTATDTSAAITQYANGALISFTNTALTVGNTFTASERMRIDSTGNVAIGTATTTNAKLTVNANTVLPATAPPTGTNLWVTGADAANSRITIDSFGSFPNLNFRRSDGTSASPTAVAANVSIGGIGGFGYGATGYSSTARASIGFQTAESWTDTAQGTYQIFSTTAIGATTQTERMRIDSVGNTYVETGNLWQYSPAPTALAAGANAGTAAQLLGGMFSAAQTTAVTLTMPTGTAIDTGFPTVPAVDIGFYFYVINTGSALGAVTVAVNTGVTSLGSLVVAIGTSAQFRLRRTAANTYIMYRLS